MINYTIVSSILVATRYSTRGIQWRVYTKDPDKPLIRDLIIEGLSLARTKEEFNSIIQSNMVIYKHYSQVKKIINN